MRPPRRARRGLPHLGKGNPIRGASAVGAVPGIDGRDAREDRQAPQKEHDEDEQEIRGTAVQGAHGPHRPQAAAVAPPAGLRRLLVVEEVAEEPAHCRLAARREGVGDGDFRGAVQALLQLLRAFHLVVDDADDPCAAERVSGSRTIRGEQLPRCARAPHGCSRRSACRARRDCQT